MHIWSRLKNAALVLLDSENKYKIVTESSKDPIGSMLFSTVTKEVLIADGEKYIPYSNKMQIEKKIESSLPIGTLLLSFLEAEDFQKEKGKGWILCDGRKVENSKYHNVTGKIRVPDCRDRFFRIAPANYPDPMGVGVGETQEQDIDVSDFNFNISSETQKTAELEFLPEGSEKWRSYPRNSFMGIESDPIEYRDLAVIHTDNTAPFTAPVVSAIKTEKIRMAEAGEVKHSHDIELVGGKETRPNNVSTNAFIRID